MGINQLEEIIQAEVEKRLKANGNVKKEPKFGLIALTNLWSNGTGYKAQLKNQFKDRLLELAEHIEGFQLFKNNIEGRGEYVLYAMVPHSVKEDHEAKLKAIKEKRND